MRLGTNLNTTTKVRSLILSLGKWSSPFAFQYILLLQWRMDREGRFGRRITDAVMQGKENGKQEPQRMERDSRKVKGSEREKKPYHIQALKSKGCTRRRSNDLGALGEWPTWGRVRRTQ